MPLHRLYDPYQLRRIKRLPPFDPERTDYTVQQLDDYATLILATEKQEYMSKHGLEGMNDHTMPGPQWLTQERLGVTARREIAINEDGTAQPEKAGNYHAPYIEK